MFLFFSVDSAPSKRIDVKGPVVELDGDEMTRIIWQMIKDKVRFENCPEIKFMRGIVTAGIIYLGNEL